jgi:putative membrane protein
MNVYTLTYAPLVPTFTPVIMDVLHTIATIALWLIGLIALIHLYILWLEMFAWTSRGPSVFKSLPADLFPATKTLAANQGLYNGFLAAGLIWSLLISDPVWQRYVAYFFLGCVAVAGLYGAATAGRRILYVQTVPALLALLLLLLTA